MDALIVDKDCGTRDGQLVIRTRLRSNTTGCVTQEIYSDGLGETGWILASCSEGGSGGSRTPMGVTPMTVGGIHSGKNLGTTPVRISDTLKDIFFPYMGPTCVLSASTSGGIREAGDSIASVTLTGTTTKNTNDITRITFYRDGNVIQDIYPVTHTGGGDETYFDYNAITSNTTYKADVSDGTTTTSSNSLTYTFIYPMYAGVGAPGLSGTSIQGLSKLLQPKSNQAVKTSPSSQVYYFAYPVGYGNLTSILDKNGFETLSDYTHRTVQITGLDSSSQTYNVYELSHITSQTDFTNTFKF